MNEKRDVEKLDFGAIKNWLRGEVEVRLPKWSLVIAAVASLALVLIAFD